MDSFHSWLRGVPTPKHERPSHPISDLSPNGTSQRWLKLCSFDTSWLVQPVPPTQEIAGSYDELMKTHWVSLNENLLNPYFWGKVQFFVVTFFFWLIEYVRRESGDSWKLERDRLWYLHCKDFPFKLATGRWSKYIRSTATPHMLHVGLYVISVIFFLPCDFQDSWVPKK